MHSELSELKMTLLQLQADPNYHSTLMRELYMSILRFLEFIGANLDIVWVSSHCGLEMNDRADEIAKSASRIPIEEQLSVPVDLKDACTLSRPRPKPLLVIEGLEEERDSSLLFYELGLSKMPLKAIGVYYTTKRVHIMRA